MHTSAKFKGRARSVECPKYIIANSCNHKPGISGRNRVNRCALSHIAQQDFFYFVLVHVRVYNRCLSALLVSMFRAANVLSVVTWKIGIYCRFKSRLNNSEVLKMTIVKAASEQNVYSQIFRPITTAPLQVVAEKSGM